MAHEEMAKQLLNAVKKHAEGHIEISISPTNIALITDSQPVSYAVYIYNDSDVDDRYAILRGRIKVTTSA